MAEEKVTVAAEETATEAAVAKKPAAKKAATKKAEPAAEKKAPAKKRAAKAAAAGTLTVKLVRSLSGRKKDQIATACSLGLHRVGHVTVQPDNAATRGKIAKIAHLVEVTNA